MEDCSQANVSDANDIGDMPVPVDISAIADIALRGIDREYARTIGAVRAATVTEQHSFVVSAGAVDVDETEDMNVSILGNVVSASGTSITRRIYERRVGTADDPLSSDDEGNEPEAGSAAMSFSNNHNNFLNDSGFRSFLEVNGFAQYMSEQNGFNDVILGDRTDHSTSSDENAGVDNVQEQYLPLDDDDNGEEFTGFMSADDFPAVDTTTVLPTGIFRSDASGCEDAGADLTTGDDSWAVFDSSNNVDYSVGSSSESNNNNSSKIPIHVSIPPLSEGKQCFYR